MVFHWSLSDSRSYQVSRTLLSILVVLNNVAVWMVFTYPPTSKSSSLFNNPLVTVPKAPIMMGIIVTFMFHNFFNSQARSRYSSFFSLSINLILWSTGTAKSTIVQILFFFVDYYKVLSSGQNQVIRLYVKVRQEFMYAILHERCLLVHIPFVRKVKFKYLADLPVDHLATQSCLVLYSFCANLLHSLII